MHIEEALVAHLLAQTGLTALISRRFFYEELPQDTILPSVTCIKISDIKDHTLTGQSELERPTYQLTTWASTKAGARAVAEQIKSILSDYQGTMGGITVQKIELQTEMSSLEKSPDGTTKVYFEDLEYQINYIK